MENVGSLPKKRESEGLSAPAILTCLTHLPGLTMTAAPRTIANSAPGFSRQKAAAADLTFATVTVPASSRWTAAGAFPPILTPETTSGEGAPLSPVTMTARPLPKPCAIASTRAVTFVDVRLLARSGAVMPRASSVGKTRESVRLAHGETSSVVVDCGSRCQSSNLSGQPADGRLPGEASSLAKQSADTTRLCDALFALVTLSHDLRLDRSEVCQHRSHPVSIPQHLSVQHVSHDPRSLSVGASLPTLYGMRLRESPPSHLRGQLSIIPLHVGNSNTLFPREPGL
jgi:hypothetical protein